MEELSYQIEISARHVHLSADTLAKLFGADAKLNPVRSLTVEGEFKSDKFVTIVGPKRSFERVAVLGPLRRQTQVEISTTDSYTLGIPDVPVRLSDDLAGSAAVRLVGPAGAVDLPEGLIIAKRHLHINQNDMQKYGLQPGQTVDITGGTTRAVTFHEVVVRQSKVPYPVVHLDTDEGNAIK